MLRLKPQPLPQRPQKSGFTIIESLLAMIIVSIMMVALGPVIVLSVATRAQTKRVETATSVARSYIDGVRTGLISAPTISNTTTMSGVLVPTSSGTLSCSDPTSAAPYCSTGGAQLYCVSLDDTAGCTHTSFKDLVIQTFAYNANSTDSTKGYQLGIRVYRADAFKDATALQTGKQLTQTAGLGGTKIPLVEMTTEIVTTNTQYSDYCTRIGGCS